MPMLNKLLADLDEHQVQYTRHSHPTAYTAKEVASVEHIPAHKIAKTVIVLSENGFAMTVLPGDSLLNLEETRVQLGVSGLRLATVGVLGDVFPDCEVGAMGPFGILCGVPVYVDADLAKEEMIAFNAGTHRDVIHMRYADFARLVNPKMLTLSRHAAA
jgi:Ala-tRNA(Pro) deacylase